MGGSAGYSPCVAPTPFAVWSETATFLHLRVEWHVLFIEEVIANRFETLDGFAGLSCNCPKEAHVRWLNAAYFQANIPVGKHGDQRQRQDVVHGFQMDFYVNRAADQLRDESERIEDLPLTCPWE